MAIIKELKGDNHRHSDNGRRLQHMVRGGNPGQKDQGRIGSHTRKGQRKCRPLSDVYEMVRIAANTVFIINIIIIFAIKTIL